MYKILLVDDEILTREAISNNMKWHNLGYDLTGTCKNGKDAIEFLTKHQKVDLVITDICMPFVDGLELAKYIYKNHPDIYVVIISGYSDFDYAKKAVKYQVKEYILKPVTVAELSHILTEIKASLDEKKIKKSNINKLETAYKQSLSVRRAFILNQLISGTMKESSYEAVVHKLKEVGWTIKGKFYKAIVVLPKNPEEFLKDTPDAKKDLPDFIIFNILEEFVLNLENIIPFQNLNGQTTLLVGYNEEKELRTKIESIFYEATQVTQEAFGLGIRFGIGNKVFSIFNIHISYETALHALDHQFFYGGKQIIDMDIISSNPPYEDIDINDDIKKLLLEIKLKDKNRINSVMELMFDKLRNFIVPKSKIYPYIQNIIISINNLFENTQDISGPLIQNEELMQKIYECDSLDHIKNILLEYILKLGNSLLYVNESFDKRQAILAWDYIDENYGNANLTLQSICNHLSISVSYFSAIFKKYTGQTFIEALTKKRIAKAMELLADTSLKVYEIAELVGFSDPQYFATTFKKYTKMTPKAYSKRRMS